MKSSKKGLWLLWGWIVEKEAAALPFPLAEPAKSAWILTVEGLPVPDQTH